MDVQAPVHRGENGEEASSNGDAFWTLLTHLKSEYYQIKKADAILQSHREQWMQYTEQWMLHQGQMVERMNLQWRKLDRSPSPSTGTLLETPRDPSTPRALSRPIQAIEPTDIDFVASSALTYGSQDERFMPRLPVAAAQQPSADNFDKAFELGDLRAPPSVPQVADMEFSPLMSGTDACQESTRASTPRFVEDGNSTSRLSQTASYKATRFSNVSAVETIIDDGGEMLSHQPSRYTDIMLTMPTTDPTDSSQIRSFSLIQQRVSSRDSHRESVNKALHQSRASISAQPRQPSAGHLVNEVVDPESEFIGEISANPRMTVTSSFLTATLVRDSTVSWMGHSHQDVTEFSFRQLAPVQARWEELVLTALHAAKKELRSLRPCWIQREQFLQKAFNSQKGNSGGLSVLQTSSARELNGSRLTKNSTRARGSMAVAQNLLSALDRSAHSIEEKARWNWRHFNPIMNPTSPKRLGWVFVGMGLMLYDLVAFPMTVFEPPETKFSMFMKYFSQIYWTFDILVSFCTGVNINGDLVMTPMKIAQVYAKTWLTFDVLVTFPLWIIIFMGWDGEGAESMKSVRYVRMLRFLRLMRLAKLEHLLGEALALVNSSMVILSFGIVKLMVYLMLLNHFNACVWYGIGSRKDGWADKNGKHVAGRGLGYKYFCAVHWSLTQFQGTSEVVPGTTLPERIYAACFLLFALMILASFVSSLTNMMMQLQSLKDEKNRQQRAIRSYLSTHKISMALSMRVKKYVDWKLQMLSSQKSNADVLAILPKALVVELLYEVRGPVISQNLFFKGLDETFSRTFRRICHEAVTLIWQAPMELIFTAVDEAAVMYFITHGVLRYRVVKIRKGSVSKQNTSTSQHENSVDVDEDLDNGSNTHEVMKGTCMCEAVLWVDWDHCGELKTVTDCAVLSLDSRMFANVIQTNPPAHASSVLYARKFLASLNKFGKVYTDILPEGGIVSMERSQSVFRRSNSRNTDVEDD